MVQGFLYYRALESVSMIASALSTALTIYPCQSSATEPTWWGQMHCGAPRTQGPNQNFE